MMYAVRCCCQPAKVLGHIDGPDGVQSFRVALMGSALDGWMQSPPQHAEVQVREFQDEHERTERAVYSEDRGLDFWRQVYGFTELRQRYVLRPGRVVSRTDGQVHFVGHHQLAMLYGVRLSECLVVNPGEAETPGVHDLPGLIHLWPRYDGQYRHPQAAGGPSMSAPKAEHHAQR